MATRDPCSTIVSLGFLSPTLIKILQDNLESHYIRDWAAESKKTIRVKRILWYGPNLFLIKRIKNISFTYIRKAVPELRKKLREFMKNQYNYPFYIIFYGCLIIDETSLENLVNNSIQEILRKIKFTN